LAFLHCGQPKTLASQIQTNSEISTRLNLGAAADALPCQACAVITAADAAVSAAATAVKVTATVIETTVDVAASGVEAVAESSDEEE